MIEIKPKKSTATARLTTTQSGGLTFPLSPICVALFLLNIIVFAAAEPIAQSMQPMMHYSNNNSNSNRTATATPDTFKKWLQKRQSQPQPHYHRVVQLNKLENQIYPMKPMKSKPKFAPAVANLPKFGKVPETIEVMPGQTAILSCIVHNLADQRVSWIRSSDLQILTSDAITFTSDPRISSEYHSLNDQEAATTYYLGLMIRNVTAQDTGQYECQINTEPKLKIFVQLLVREPQLMDLPFSGIMIEGSRQQVVKMAQTVTFSCTGSWTSTLDQTTAQKTLIWSMNGEALGVQTIGGGINIFTEWQLSGVSSKLTIAHVTGEMAGLYRCSVDGIGADEIQLEVVGNYGGGAQHQKSTSNADTSAVLQLLLPICHAFVVLTHFL